MTHLKIIVTSLVFSAAEVIPNVTNQGFTTPNLPPRLLPQVQKVVVLNSCSFVRKFLIDEVHLSDKEADNL